MLPRIISSKSPINMKAILISACGLGCFCHFIIINVDYFKYETVAVYAPYIPLEQVMPHTSLCFVPFYPNHTNVTFMNLQLPFDLLTNKTVVNLSVSQVISNCEVKNFTTGLMDANVDCSVFFKAIRAVRLQYYICYTIQSKEKRSFTTLETAAALANKYAVYSFTLDSSLLEYSRMSFFSHIASWPQNELLYLKDIDTSDVSRKSSSFALYFEILEFERLPSPYNTHCILSYPVNCRLADERPLCHQDLCNQVLTITYVRRTAKQTLGIDLNVRSQSTPNELVKYTPRIDPATFFIEACSVIGLWCSLSVSSLITSLIHVYKRTHRFSTLQRMKRWNHESRVIRVTGDAEPVPVRATVINRVPEVKKESPPASSLARRSLIILTKIVVLALFAREFTFLSIDYFKYRTRMTISRDEDNPLRLPDVSYCFSMYEWFNITQPRYRYTIFDKQMTESADRCNYTLRQMFNSLPDQQDAIKMCRVRPAADSPLMVTDDCVSHFNVTKFYSSEMLCYHFRPLVDYNLSIMRRSLNDSHPNILYSLIPSEKVSRNGFFQPIVSLGLPGISRFLSNRLFKITDRELIILSFFVYEYTNLPAPYDTMCDEEFDDTDCNVNCMDLSRFNLAANSELHSRLMPFRLVNYNDLKNATLARLIRGQEINCSRTCKGLCHDSITKTLQYRSYSSDESLELALAVPRYPPYQFNAIPVYTPYTFIYQLACCASFWLGFSLFMIVNFCHLKISTFHSPPVQTDVRDRRLFTTREEAHRSVERTKSLASRRSTVQVNNFGGKVMKRISLFTLTVGFCVHSFFVVTNYFRYRTTVDTRLESESNYTHLTATFCISIDQFDLRGNYSISNILSQSPRTQDIILECGLRGAHLPEIAHLPSVLQERVIPWINSTGLCYSYLDVRKYISLAMVCYEIQARDGTYEAEFLSKYHVNSMKTFQYINLRQALSVYKLQLAMSQGSADESLMYAATLSPTNRSKKIWSWISYLKYRVDSPPYPYDTGVFDALNQIDCLRECVSQRTENQLKLISSYGEVHHSSALAHQTLNESVSSVTVKIRNQCEKRCSLRKFHEKIETSYYKTFQSGPYDDHRDRAENGTNGLWFRSTDYYVPHTFIFPSLRLLDLVLYTGSIYSIWFGLSALQTVDALFSSSHLSPLLGRAGNK